MPALLLMVPGWEIMSGVHARTIRGNSSQKKADFYLKQENGESVVLIGYEGGENFQ